MTITAEKYSGDDRRQSRNDLCQQHSEQLDYLCRAHDQVNGRVAMIENVINNNHEELKQILQDRRDREGVKRYAKKASGFIIAAAATVTAIGVLFTKTRFW